MSTIFSQYYFFEKRIELYNCFKSKGFYVRMHAYEYIIGDYKTFKAIVFIEPFYSRTYIKVLDKKDKEALKTIIDCIRSGDPQNKIILG